MNIFSPTTCLILVFYSSFNLSYSQQGKSSLIINIPTIEQEARSIWRTINDIIFLEEQGYKINLPSSQIIDSLISKSKRNKFSNKDFPVIYNLLESEVFKEQNYVSAYKRVKREENLLNQLIIKLKQASKSWNWHFRFFESYTVVLTVYGTGGSYDPDSGLITLFTTTSGKFMQYENPANTIIHEIVHLGIESSLIQKYSVPHVEKEKTVDSIVKILFSKYLPKYKVQKMRLTQLDNKLTKTEDIKNLHLILSDL